MRDGALKYSLAIIVVLAIVVVALKVISLRQPLSAKAPEAQQADALPPSPEPAPPSELPAPVPVISGPNTQSVLRAAQKAAPAASATNKLDRLAQIREEFRRLAAGDPGIALRAAKEQTDGTERETALLTLVTEWT